MTNVNKLDKMEECVCKICLRSCDSYANPALQCKGNCNKKIHITCLNRGTLPTNFAGDVFYKLICEKCNPLGEEIITRDKMSWLTTITLVLYNLRERSSGISNKGYFHWKSNVSTFVDHHWDHLFKMTTKRSKNWIGTISGTLSHYSGTFFQSGTAELGEAGWWKLIDYDPPEVLMDRYNKMLDSKKQTSNQTKKKTVKNHHVDSLPSKMEIKFENKANNCLQDHKNLFQKKSEFINKVEHENGFDSQNFVCNGNIHKPSNNIEKSLIDNVFDVLPSMDNYLHFDGMIDPVLEESPLPTETGLPAMFLEDCLKTVQEDAKKTSNLQIYEQIDVNSLKYLQCEDEFLNTFCTENNLEQQRDDEFDDEISIDEPIKVNNFKNESSEESASEDALEIKHERKQIPPAPPSLFKSSIRKRLPWENKIDIGITKPLMNEGEEEYLLQQIGKFSNFLDNASPSIRRLYRKLCVRKKKRQCRLPILNIDNFEAEKPTTIKHKKKGYTLLDRFIAEDYLGLFEQRLQGHCEPTSVHSPYTNRLLKPFIRRDTTSRPLWLRVQNELISKVNKNNLESITTAPIDYSYVRPQHIPALNSLCTQFFWPGVDLTECLQYPEFTCVVLYKKLVIGFATMIPDVGYNEAYISFFLVRPEWRKAGIGCFMLYHLIQTCMGKDITLHVSATNPAVILYQKFGFKIEEFIQDFYDKYMPVSSKECRHALFLRLSR